MQCRISDRPHRRTPGTSSCRDTRRKAKAHLELSLARDIKAKKKGFCNFIISERKVQENAGPLLNQMGVLVMEDSEKVKSLKAFLACLHS